MNFYDYSFIFAFFPLVLLGAKISRKFGQAFQYTFLIAASLVFYASWSTAAPLLLIGSVLFNYLVGTKLRHRPHFVFLSVVVAVNVGLLAYFKYLGFLVDNLARVLPIPDVLHVVLPLGISFFTFQQISYLVDSYRNETGEHSFLSYVLFIVLFPHVIAGPIVLQSDVLRQLNKPSALRIDSYILAAGLAMFIVGLAKKIIVADSFGAYASPLFAKAVERPLGFEEGWQAAVAYTFQIYFDFSGYSDMAVGLGLCLGVRLPFNFNSPYKSRSIAEFWRRWHMSLSRFLRYYLYYPLGGNRGRLVQTARNLMIVMLIGGIWHGASWTFVAWGGLHGLFLLINRFWSLKAKERKSGSPLKSAVSWLGTLVAVVFAWVLFRSPDVATAARIWQGMVGLGPDQTTMVTLDFWWMAIAALVACVTLPNSQQIILSQGDGATTAWWRFLVWSPSWAWGLTLGSLFAVVLVWTWQVGHAPEFIYFNF